MGVALVSLLGCDSATAPDAGLPEATFSFEAHGDSRHSYTGRGVLLPNVPAGFVVVNPSGTRTDYEVTPILLAEQLAPRAPQLYIGLLNGARVGTYTVYGRNAALEFYADFMVPMPDDVLRRFAITGGTLTITKVTAQGVSGRFNLESRVYFDWPANAAPGTSSAGVPTSMSLTGSFVAIASTRYSP